MHGPMPPLVMLAKSVVFLPRFRGTRPWALWPLGALALRRVMEVCVPHSSTNTRRPGSRRLTPSCQRALSASSRSEAGRDFFERQPQTPEGAAEAGDGDRPAALVLEELAVLL